jgi:nucleotide-binding universal stress UspA family protein
MDAMVSYDRIVTAVDFSEHARKALDAAAELARKFDSELHLVHAFELPFPVLTPYEVALPENFVGDARAAARRELDELEKELSAAGVKVTVHLREGPPDAAIDELAQEINADLIVIGTRGNSGLKHVLLGSVAERTLRHAPCPVLTIK